MLAVATAPVKGTSAGGAGFLALWSYNRPFMPLSVLDGHRDGAINDFEWVETPCPFSKTIDLASVTTDLSSQAPGTIWQHVVSVGRDGRCLLQSFVRGKCDDIQKDCIERLQANIIQLSDVFPTTSSVAFESKGINPMLGVPASCFAMANLSPFQSGYGSLQFFSVTQKVPYTEQSYFAMTGLRRDKIIAQTPGVFRERPLEHGSHAEDLTIADHKLYSGKLPSEVPELLFNVIDQGDLDSDLAPVGAGILDQGITVAPEVVHLSRFANQYALHPNDELLTLVDLCHHNAMVAQKLLCDSLALMWLTLSSILGSSGVDGLQALQAENDNVMAFVLLPTIKALLEERADAGDVQTCVVLCEVLQVFSEDGTLQIQGLSLHQVREWYLSYIDLLRDMCLFSNATYIIKHCKDSYIAALNQNSTT
jgi:WD repeat-containing protein 24